MKWYHTLSFKISIIFFIALIGLGGAGFIFITHQTQEDAIHIKQYTRSILRSFYDRHAHTIDSRLFKEEGFEFVTDSTLQRTLLTLNERKHFLIPRPNPAIHPMMRRPLPLNIVHYRGHFYALLVADDAPAIILKTPYASNIKGQLILFVLLASLLIVLYFLTLRSIRPLKPLKESIEALAKGDYDVRCQNKGKDEIAAVANAFDTTVQKIKHLRDARQLFLRNIMHEMKTPIMKGKLSVEMIEESPYRQKLTTVFNRQEHLLEEFARIEKLSAGEITLHRQDYALEDILAQVLDILDDKLEHIHIHVTPYSLHVDFDLFSTALKNLIDNGINYSLDHRVSVTLEENRLYIRNQGPALEYPLERYKEPYFLEGKKQQESRGLGFGLFIALQIFALHECKVTYTHDAGVSCFMITLLETKGLA